MKLEIFQVDAFAEKVFEGNPAAVVPLVNWLPDDTMQAIAEENNLAETAFLVPIESGFHIRWFTPVAEVALCGHATLAAAFVLYDMLGVEREEIRFESASGQLIVTRSSNGRLQLDFPAQQASPRELPQALAKGLNLTGMDYQCLAREDFIVVLESAAELRELRPVHHYLEALDLRGVIVTARADNPAYDFYARFFAPKLGVPEDPVTGSAYTQLTPYWQSVMGKTEFRARQLSPRGGDVYCESRGDRVLIAGSALCYLRGEIEVDSP